MNKDDPERSTSEAVSLLKDLGLTEYEAATFVILLRLGTGTAKDVSEMDDVPRTRVYDAVESLHEEGLVDIQYTTPRKFTAVSRETAVRKLNLSRENTIAELSEVLERLEPQDPQTEQQGVWTVTGHDAVRSRVLEFIENADEKIILMTIDDLLDEEVLDPLEDADERGVSIHIAGVSESVQARIQDRVPSVDVFETLWKWSETPAGTLLFTDEQTVLVSVMLDGDGSGEIDETAVWGSGANNSLVVVFRAIFTWRLESQDSIESPDS